MNFTEILDTARQHSNLTPEQLRAKYSAKQLVDIASKLGVYDRTARKKAQTSEAIAAKVKEVLAAVGGGTNVATESFDDRLDNLYTALAQTVTADAATVPSVVAGLYGAWVAADKAEGLAASTLAKTRQPRTIKHLKPLLENKQTKLAADMFIGMLKAGNRAVTAELNQAYGARVAEKNRDQSLPESGLVIKAVNIVNETALGNDIPAGRNYADLGLALMVVTGRRPSEIFYQGSEFRALSERRLEVSGLAKTKGSTMEDKTVEMSVPCPAENIVSCINILEREGRRKDDRAEVNKGPSMALSRKMESFAPGLKMPEMPKPGKSDKAKAYDLRKLWGSYQLVRYKSEYETTNHVRMTNAAYLAQMLGHNAKDNRSVQSYMGYSSNPDDWTQEALTL